MEFYEWLISKRKSYGWKQDELAKKAGVSTPTISRIERGQTELTLTAAYKICQGFGLSLTALLRELEVECLDLDGTLSDDLQCTPSGITNNEMEKFLRVAADNYQAAKQILVECMEYISGMKSYPFTNIIDIMLSKQSQQCFSCTINYPELNDKLVNQLTFSGALVSPSDAGNYLRWRRNSRGYTIKDIAKFGINSSTLSRIENGDVNRMFFSDLVFLDKYIDEKGKLLMTFWNMAKYLDMCEPYQRISQTQQTIDMDGFASLFFIVCRWMQSLTTNDAQPMEDLRTKISNL